jgi:hypothetical protein
VGVEELKTIRKQIKNMQLEIKKRSKRNETGIKDTTIKQVCKRNK